MNICCGAHRFTSSQAPATAREGGYGKQGFRNGGGKKRKVNAKVAAAAPSPAADELEKESEGFSARTVWTLQLNTSELPLSMAVLAHCCLQPHRAAVIPLELLSSGKALPHHCQLGFAMAAATHSPYVHVALFYSVHS